MSLRQRRGGGSQSAMRNERSRRRCRRRRRNAQLPPPPPPPTVSTAAACHQHSEFLVAGGSSEAVLGPRAGHATPGPSALVLRHACVGVTGGRVPRHRRKVAAASGPGCANSGGPRGTAADDHAPPVIAAAAAAKGNRIATAVAEIRSFRIGALSSPFSGCPVRDDGGGGGGGSGHAGRVALGCAPGKRDIDFENSAPVAVTGAGVAQVYCAWRISPAGPWRSSCVRHGTQWRIRSTAGGGVGARPVSCRAEYKHAYEQDVIGCRGEIKNNRLSGINNFVFNDNGVAGQVSEASRYT